jgi:hypothetical protein
MQQAEQRVGEVEGLPAAAFTLGHLFKDAKRFLGRDVEFVDNGHHFRGPIEEMVLAEEKRYSKVYIGAIIHVAWMIEKNSDDTWFNPGDVCRRSIVFDSDELSAPLTQAADGSLAVAFDLKHLTIKAPKDNIDRSQVILRRRY